MADTRIRRIPTRNDVSGPVSLRPSGANPGIDVNAQYEGGAALAAGMGRLAAGLGSMGEQFQRQELASQVAKADAEWLRGSLDIGNTFEHDPDFGTFNERAGKMTTELRDRAAALITDPVARQSWLDQTELKRISLMDAVNDRGTALKREGDRVQMEESITSLAELYADPTTPIVVRDGAKRNIEAQIKVGEQTGLLSPSEASRLRKAGIEGAEQGLAINRAELDILNNPRQALTGLGIPAQNDDGSGVVAAVASANGGQLPTLSPELAAETAKLLGDANFPEGDERLAKAYLSDPEVAGQYATAAAAMLADRYKGDLTAVVVAMHGGTDLADEWVRSKHNEDVLPPAVKDRFRASMGAYKAEVSGDRIPIAAAPDVDLLRTDPAVLSRYEQLQSAFGETLPVISAKRSEEHNKEVGGASKSRHIHGDALDIDVSKLSEERRAEFIRMASAMGFTGIGVYKNSIHLDTGELRAWGPDYKKGSVPAWAKDSINLHLSGDVEDIPLVATGVDARYAAIPFDKRLILANKARSAMKEQDINLRTSLETIAANAPAAIANTGNYDGDMPTPAMFVQAYGAADGIQKYRAFEAAVDTSRAMYGFRSQSSEEIMRQVAAAAPTSTGNDALIQSKRFDAISAAAQQVIDARTKDPAGYVMNTFPSVMEAFQSAGAKDAAPEAFGEALTLMQQAQADLGIAEPELLPKSMAAQAASAFNDATLPAADRVNAVASLLLRTDKPDQQALIFKQLLGAGLPEYTQGAVNALVRGDVGGAQQLMRAAMIDPAKLAGDLNGVTSAQISETIQDQIFNENMIGDAIYGVQDGSIDNFARMMADATLIERDVRLRLIDGSANGNVQEAVRLTIKDMYGDMRVMRGRNTKVALPADIAPEPMQRGFTGLMPAVETALRTDMRNGMIMILGDDVDPRRTGMSEIIKNGVDNAVNQIMAEGYFINAPGEQYQFFNPYTGSVIASQDGKPVLFSRADVLAAGANVRSPVYPSNPNATPERMRGIYGSTFGRDLQTPWPN